MIAFLLTIYTAVVIVLFKRKVLTPRPYPIAGVIVVGIAMIGSVVVAWTLCAPVSPRVVTSQYVIQLVPYVKGQVKKIHVQANQPIKKGELLLEINPEPYQYKVQQMQAQVKSAQEGVKQANASLDAAKANVKQTAAGVSQSKAALENAAAGVVKAQAAADLAKSDEQIALNLQKADPGAISVLRVNQAVQNREEKVAALRQAEISVKQHEAGVQQAEAVLAAARATEQQQQFGVNVAESKVPGADAQLEDARFDLNQCRMTAPADGYVVNWVVREGTMLVPMPLAAAGTFICTEETMVIASFPQSYLTNVQPDDDVELILDPYPGRLFHGKVDTVISATGEGQSAPGGTIPMASRVGSQGLLAVKIRLTGDAPANIPLGAGGTVTIYTSRGKPVHIISKVTIRMKKWLSFVIPG